MRLFKNTNYDFLSLRKTTSIISLVIIVAGLISLLVKGGPALAIDFTGGTTIWLKFDSAPNIAELRSNLSDAGYESTEVTTIGSDEQIQIKTGANQNNEELVASLTDAFSDKTFEVLQVELVGPKIGKELSADALQAIGLALLLILIYISFRFDLYYALGAVSALVHDVLITLGLFSIFNLEISLVIVAAFLTIVGYSLNDTIVVFDRIRENILAHSREKLENIVNKSLNGTLSRTVITSITTFVVVLVLALFGGEVIKLFAVALLIGVVVGTYSSMYVASPVMIYFENRREQKLRKR